MSSSPVKLFGFIGVAAMIAAGTLSKNLESNEPVQNRANGTSHAPATTAKSWISSFFDGTESGHTPAAAQQPKVQVATAAEPVRQFSQGFGAVQLKADKSGQYHARIEIEGRIIPMLVDTGATVVVLTSEDAERLGIYPAPSDFTMPVATANGELRAANTRLREVRLESITVRDVQAIVMPRGVLTTSLLGMSFMKKLASFQSSNGELVLKP